MKKSVIMLLLSICGGLASCGESLASEIIQRAGEDHLGFQGEGVGEVLNPDAADDIRLSVPTGQPELPVQVWMVASDAAALGGRALRAPVSPHKQVSDPARQESIAVYRLRFAEPGAYHAYLRVRNGGVADDGSTDSLWFPEGWGENEPSMAVSTGQTGNYTWRQPGSMDVSAGQVGALLEFRVGVRESEAHLDAVVLSRLDGLDPATLDAMVPAPSPPPTSGVVCVSTVTELDTAIADAQPGDTILMCNGVWRDAVIQFEADGLPGLPITLRAEVDGQVRLEGESQLCIAGDYLVVRGLHFTNGTTPGGDVIQFRRRGSSDYANHSRLTECAITDYNPPDPGTNYKWVSVYGISNRVDHCRFSGMNHAGVTLTVWVADDGSADYTRIDGNFFSHRPPGGGNGFETIRIGTSGVSNQPSRTLVESNLFYRCDGEIEIISSKSVGNVFRRNTFIENQGQLTLRHGSACRVEGNFFLGNHRAGSSGVRIVGPDHVVLNNYFADLEGDDSRAAIAIMNGIPDSPLNGYLRAESALVAFNTFVNCEQTFAIGTVGAGGATTLAPKDCVFANNVVLSSRGPLVNVVTAPESPIYEGNILFGAPTGIPPTPGVTTADPRLAIAEDGLWRPAGDSPVIDAAAGSYPQILTDMDGDARTIGSQDAGADEVSAAPPAFRPVGPNDVGPRWMRTNLVRILGVSVEANSAWITFEDDTGLAPWYRLERTFLGGDSAWTHVADLVPAANTTTVFQVSDASPNPTSAVWRVVAAEYELFTAPAASPAGHPNAGIRTPSAMPPRRRAAARSRPPAPAAIRRRHPDAPRPRSRPVLPTPRRPRSTDPCRPPAATGSTDANADR